VRAISGESPATRAPAGVYDRVGAGERDIDASDEQLVQSARQGSPEAFTALVRRYRDGLLRFLVVRCGSHADAEDALQDALVNAWRYLASYDARWRFSTWLYRIAIRSAARERRRAVPGGYEPAEAVPDDTDPLADNIDREARENLWRTARRVLSGDACAAMWLHYVEDLPLAEVAAALDRSRSWTKVTLMRSRRRLKKEYDDEATSD
jgi:RNA polymerase sigma-70 factor (ECF subfamily)